MKALFQQYKPVLFFLLRFLGSYVLLSLLYGGYLQYAQTDAFSPDAITQLVAQQSEALLKGVGYDAAIIPNVGHPSIQLWISGKVVGHLVEGCNAVSIIILFIAFVLAFAQGWKKTLLFLLAGGVLIYAMNLVRIAILSVALYNYPEYEHSLHTVVFPGIIYGMVFLLWIIWVRLLQTKKPIGDAADN